MRKKKLVHKLKKKTRLSSTLLSTCCVALLKNLYFSRKYSKKIC